jgi:hydrogenase/urease accessory protein HupE
VTLALLLGTASTARAEPGGGETTALLSAGLVALLVALGLILAMIVVGVWLASRKTKP